MEFQQQIDQLKDDVNTFWMIFGTSLVFVMELGFTLLEVGSVQEKNVKSILIVNLTDIAISILSWYVIGYALVFGGTNYGSFDANPFIGTDNFVLTGKFRNKSYGIASGMDWAFFLYQWTFCSTASTIVNGAVAERVNFLAYVMYSISLNSFIYPIIAHMAWSTQGWASMFNEHASRLLGCGIIDHAGSLVVHMTGGLSSLICAYMIGPRNGRFINNQVMKIPQYSVVFQCLGTIVLIFGWFGFNTCSSAIITGKSLVAARTITNTIISAGSACISSLIISRIVDRYISLTAVNNGLLAGLVAITSGCAVVNPEISIVIGSVAGVVYYGSSKLLLKLKIDDVVDASAVHYFCGLWGFFSTGLFAVPDMYALAYYDDRKEKCSGCFYGGSGRLIGSHVIFILVHFGFVSTCCFTIFLICKYTVGLRTSASEEEEGLDSRHGGTIDYKQTLSTHS